MPRTIGCLEAPFIRADRARDRDTVAISLWPDRAALTRGEPSVRQDMCYVAADQHTNLTYVLGDNWIVFPERATTARRLGPLLHAAVTTIRC